MHSLTIQLLEQNERIRYLRPLDGYPYLLAGHTLMADIALALLVLDESNLFYSAAVRSFDQHKAHDLPALKLLYGLSQKDRKPGSGAVKDYKRAFALLQGQTHQAVHGIES